jgi:SP family general alpha glucoside:H+ symporter-like MFS transporter
MSAGIGRRTLFVYGLCGLCVTLMIIGFVGIARGRVEDRTVGLVTGSLMLLWATIYQITVG